MTPISEIVTHIMVLTMGRATLTESSPDGIGFDDNGERHYEYTVKNGYFDGCCLYWDSKGTLRIEEYYRSGWLNGYRRVYDEKGSLQQLEYYGKCDQRQTPLSLKL